MTLQHDEERLLSVLRHMWGNGSRPLIIGAAFFVAAVVFLLAVSLYITIHNLEKPPANPLTSPSPEQIINKMPSYRDGDVIMVLGTKCNSSNRTLKIAGISNWESLDFGGMGSVVTNTTLATSTPRLVPKGCMALAFPHTIPQLPAGNWRLAGTDCIVQSATCAHWFTDTFKVAP